MNKKEKRAALKSALSDKCQSGKLIVLDEIKMDEKKTKTFAEMMTAVGATDKSLVVTGGHDENVILSARNLPKVKTSESTMINVYDIVNAQTLVLTKDAVAKIEEVYI